MRSLFCSLLLLVIPSLVFADPIIVAHRGMIQHAPENTMVAFRTCLQLGIGIEVDVRRSSDGHLICVHDSTVNRTSNGRGLVSALTLRQLKQLDVGSWFHPSFGDQRVPTIDEILKEAAKHRHRRVLIALDLKAADVEADCVQLAKKHGVLSRVLFIGSTITSAGVRSKLYAADAKASIATVAHNHDEFLKAVKEPRSNWVYFRYLPSADELLKVHSSGRRAFIAGKTVAGRQSKNWRLTARIEMDAVLTDFPLELAKQLRTAQSRYRAQDRAAETKGTTKMDQQFQEIAERYLDESMRHSPVGATATGDHRFDNVIDQVSEEARAAERKMINGLLKSLADITRGQLSRDNQVDFLVLQRALEKQLWQLDTLKEWQWNPLVYTRLAGGSVYNLMARDYAPVAERLKSAAERMQQLPRLYAQVRETLNPKLVPPVHAQTAAKQHRGVLSIIDNMIRPKMDEVDEALRKELTAAIEVATKAVEEHQQWIDAELLPSAAGDFRLGPRMYDQKLEHTLGTPLSRQQIRDLAERELKRVRAEMYEIARPYYAKQNPSEQLPDNPSDELQQKVIEAVLEIASTDIPASDQVVATVIESMKTTTDFVKERDLVTVPPDPLEIIEMPEFQRGVSFAYCDSPGPLEVGQKTFYAVAPLPENWTQEQATSFLREYNIRSIHNLTIHEAMPGHFLQLAHSNRHPSQLRAVLWSGTFVEGWACYTEQVMSDAGFLDGDPLMRLVMLKWYLRSIANSIMDQAIHVDGMRRADAMKLMMEDTFQEEREASAKWVRAQLTSTQLSTYFVGLHEHFSIREAAKKEWGDEFTLKRYHDAVISFGSPPPQFVRALLLGEAIE